MTADEWRTSSDPAAMLLWLLKVQPLTLLMQRRLQLFACACCRQVWHLLADKRSQVAVEVTERHATGFVHVQDRDLANARAKIVSGVYWAHDASPGARSRAKAEKLAAGTVASTVIRDDGNDWNAADVAMLAADPSAAKEDRLLRNEVLADILRDIVGKPFRLIPGVPQLSTHRDVRLLAQTAYEERCMPQGTLHPGRLAVLSDALEEAGFNYTACLEHLRAPGPHWMGCWAVDLLRMSQDNLAPVKHDFTDPSLW